MDMLQNLPNTYIIYEIRRSINIIMLISYRYSVLNNIISIIPILFEI